MELTTPQGLSAGGPVSGSKKALLLPMLIGSVVGIAIGAAGYYLILDPVINKNTANSNTSVVIANTNTSSSTTPTNQSTTMVPTTCQVSQFTREERELFDSSLYPDGPPSLAEQCFGIQQLRLSSLMVGLSIYKEGIPSIAAAEGHFPTSLDELMTDLKQKEADCKATVLQQTAPPEGLSGPSCDNISNFITRSIYTDVYTGQTFPYKSLTDDYEVTYVLRFFPGMETGTAIPVKEGLVTIKGSEYQEEQ